MGVSFVPVKTDDQIEELGRLAGEIWRGYWPPLIGAAQTEYMVERFQTADAIRRGMAEQQYRYWFIEDDEAKLTADPEGARGGWTPVVGYTGGYTEPETNRFFISKIYLLPQARGRGYCSRVIEFYHRLCAAEGLHALYLTVNKGNELGIRAYTAKGFKVIDAVEADIGSGFIMDDYIMECPVR